MTTPSSSTETSALERAPCCSTLRTCWNSPPSRPPSLAVIFSADYMHGERQLGRYYALVLLFIGAMAGLVLTGSLLLLFAIGIWMSANGLPSGARKLTEPEPVGLNPVAASS